jgi:UPF0716 protein FxsA
MWVFLMFAAVPLIEVALFVVVGGQIGVWATLGLVMLSVFLGGLILRVQGLRSVMAMQRQPAGIETRLREGADGLLLAMAGILLILPGFLSDGVALALLLPPVRSGVIALLQRRFRVTPGQDAQDRAGPRRDGVIIDAEFIEVDPESLPPRNGGSGWTRH